MGRYLFQAKNSSGQLQTGQIEAANENEAKNKLRSQSLVPLRLVVAPAIKQAGQGGIFGPPKASAKDLQIFTRQLSTLINAGITVVDALKMLGEGKRSPALKEAANKVRNSIEGGKRLGDSMAAQGHIFDNFFVNMVRAGEEAGILDTILSRLATYMEKSEKMKKQIIGAMMYPAIIVFMASLVIAAILLFVIPKMQELYAQSGGDLPAPTKIVIAISDMIKARWYFILAAMIGAPLAFRSYYNSDKGREVCDRVFIALPLFGELIQKASIAKMTRTLSTLLSSGVGMLEALDIAAKTAGNKVIEDTIVRCKESVTSGKPLAAPLFKEKYMPDMVTQMISIGEQTGALDQMLTKIADFYEDDVDNVVKALTSMIEPLLMVGLGSIIAGLVVAMYLPIFGLASTVGK